MTKKRQKSEPSVKPSYLLTADEASMERWRGAAEPYPSFAAFARSALDTAAVSSAGLPGRFIGDDLVAIGTLCYTGQHSLCRVDGCECSCH